jgi:hypothetical protein
MARRKRELIAYDLGEVCETVEDTRYYEPSLAATYVAVLGMGEQPVAPREKSRYEIAAEYAKAHGLEHYMVTVCHECREPMPSQQFAEHRKAHEDPRGYGLRGRVGYYPGVLYHQAQIVLNEPHSLQVDTTWHWEQEPCVMVSASDHNAGMPDRAVSLYLRPETARRLARELLAMADRAEGKES